MRFNKLIPELVCSDFGRSLAFYTELLGFRVCYRREEEKFAFLEREEAQLMIEETSATAQITGELGAPYGRGINLQIETADVRSLYEKLQGRAYPVFVALRERWFRQNDVLIGNVQFLIQDPDGYLLRFLQPIGTKPAAAVPETGGRAGPDPVRYGDWEKNGRCVDF